MAPNRRKPETVPCAPKQASTRRVSAGDRASPSGSDRRIMDAIDTRLAELGITLPEPFPPVGNYVSCSRTGDLLFVGGHGPIDGATTIVGKVGTDLTIEQGREAARLTGL